MYDLIIKSRQLWRKADKLDPSWGSGAYQNNFEQTWWLCFNAVTIPITKGFGDEFVVNHRKLSE